MVRPLGRTAAALQFPAVPDDVELVHRLRQGDEGGLVALVDRYHAPLLRFASTMVPSRAVAEEVVQDTWLGLLRGIGGFEGRSSLKTWLYQILVNRARSASGKEGRTVPFSPEREPAVDPARFGGDGRWSVPPVAWTDDVEDRIQAEGMVERVAALLDRLPSVQRQVVTLRDLEGLPAGEVCRLLDLTDGNQRVLLHRGRSAVRRWLAAELGEEVAR
jgi:RNA polymerase sigma-70 factor, ECF subfamily